MNKIKEQLIERYINTGKVGFTKLSSMDEALHLIDNIILMYDSPNQTIPQKEVEIVNLCDMTEKLRNYFKDDI